MGCPTHHRTTHFVLFACKSLIHFHQFGNAGALAGTGGAAFYKTIGIHHSTVIGLVRLVVCGDEVDEDVKNDIAVAKRLNITATTLDGILTVNQQGRHDV